MKRSIAERIELVRATPIAWNPARAARVSERILQRRRHRAVRSRFLECLAATVASAALLMGLIRVSAAARDTSEPSASEPHAIMENSPAPLRAAERVSYADGALGDGGYEASLQ